MELWPRLGKRNPGCPSAGKLVLASGTVRLSFGSRRQWPDPCETEDGDPGQCYADRRPNLPALTRGMNAASSQILAIRNGRSTPIIVLVEGIQDQGHVLYIAARLGSFLQISPQGVRVWPGHITTTIRTIAAWRTLTWICHGEIGGLFGGLFLPQNPCFFENGPGTDARNPLILQQLAGIAPPSEAHGVQGVAGSNPAVPTEKGGPGLARPSCVGPPGACSSPLRLLLAASVRIPPSRWFKDQAL
jgi:hypothetical protein